MPMKLSANFNVTELVPPEVYNKWGDNSIWFINPKLIDCLELLKKITTDFYQEDVKIIINNWDNGGNFKYSGFRPPNIDVEIGGATFSQHKLGNAADVKCYIKNRQIPVNQILDLVLSNKTKFMNLGLTTIEDIKFTKTWLHMDCRWTGKDDLLIVKP